MLPRGPSCGGRGEGTGLRPRRALPVSPGVRQHVIFGPDLASYHKSGHGCELLPQVQGKDSGQTEQTAPCSRRSVRACGGHGRLQGRGSHPGGQKTSERFPLVGTFLWVLLKAAFKPNRTCSWWRTAPRAGVPLGQGPKAGAQAPGGQADLGGAGSGSWELCEPKAPPELPGVRGHPRVLWRPLPPAAVSQGTRPPRPPPRRSEDGDLDFGWHW